MLIYQCQDRISWSLFSHYCLYECMMCIDRCTFKLFTQAGKLVSKVIVTGPTEVQLINSLQFEEGKDQEDVTAIRGNLDKVIIGQLAWYTRNIVLFTHQCSSETGSLWCQNTKWNNSINIFYLSILLENTQNIWVLKVLINKFLNIWSNNLVVFGNVARLHMTITESCTLLVLFIYFNHKNWYNCFKVFILLEDTYAGKSWSS